jgi:hypothetical protein
MFNTEKVRLSYILTPLCRSSLSTLPDSEADMNGTGKTDTLVSVLGCGYFHVIAATGRVENTTWYGFGSSPSASPSAVTY